MRYCTHALFVAGFAAFAVQAAWAADSPVPAAPPTLLRAEGNRIVNADGKPVRLKGLMIPDPAVAAARGLYGQDLFKTVAAAGANAIRIPVHPKHWMADPEYLERYVEPAVRWAGELGMYCIVDWHSIGDVEAGDAPLMKDLYCHTKDMTMDFWRRAAARLKGAENAVFEIFNEPQGISAPDWKRNAEEIIAAIRGTGAGQLLIVGGVDYSKVLSWALQTPVSDGNVAYAAHIYPQHSKFLWDVYFGDTAKRYPVLITEWGFMDENRVAGEELLAGSAESYGKPLMAYLDTLSVGWIACWYDDDWRPPMLSEGQKGLTRFGEFVMAALRSVP